ncbi:protein LYK5-like [Trifolium pratense]|uniref:Protein LYK5-like n=1 Tax=Trifolium pratense TaxID=57577 RepID=A0A2K3MWI2_TRIPR|nr:protein LYK5-like [Trifolium pratense]PNX95160.1 protein LYK5-like [Trifolium pratense]PNY12300.1 protein LYK5-like [Trifolium pratense]
MRASTTSCLSPDFLVGIKYCLLNYHIEEIEKATNFFSDMNKIGDFVYKGLINDIEVMVKRLRFEDTSEVDIFAFGVVLLELISGRENLDGKLMKDCVGFLLGEGSEGGGCFEGLRNFVDPNLKEYSLPEALCLCFLAKDCVKDDPLLRPSMDDIMKVLAKMV